MVTAILHGCTVEQRLSDLDILNLFGRIYFDFSSMPSYLASGPQQIHSKPRISYPAPSPLNSDFCFCVLCFPGGEQVYPRKRRPRQQPQPRPLLPVVLQLLAHQPRPPDRGRRVRPGWRLPRGLGECVCAGGPS